MSMVCRDKPVGTVRNLNTLTICVERLLILSGQIIGKSEVVPDIKLQRAGRNVSRVWLAIGLGFIRLAFDQLRCFLQIGNGEVKAAQSNLAMAAMAIEACVSRKALDTF